MTETMNGKALQADGPPKTAATLCTAADDDMNSKGDGGDRDVLAKLQQKTSIYTAATAVAAAADARPTSFNVTATPFVSQLLRTSTPHKDGGALSHQQQQILPATAVHQFNQHQHASQPPPPLLPPQAYLAPGSVHYVQHGAVSFGGSNGNGVAASSSSPSVHVTSGVPSSLTSSSRLPAQQTHSAGAVHSAIGPKGVDERIWRNISAHRLQPMYGYDSELPRIPSSHSQFTFSGSRHRQAMSSHSHHAATHRGDCMDSTAHTFGPVALPNGTIQIRLRDGIRVDMTLDKAVRVINCKSRIAIGLSSNASTAALIHPNGRVYQFGTRVEICAYDGMQTNNYVRYAKMWYKGVSFTSENCALIYLVDAAGTRTTTDLFTDLSVDYTIHVFLNESRYGPSYAEEALGVLQNANYWCNDDGTEVFDINGFRITQTADGLVKVTRSNNKCLIRTSPGNGSATLTTAFMHCTASLGQTSHLFVRRGERRMHFDGSSFVVRNAGHSAGFDDNNLLKVY